MKNVIKKILFCVPLLVSMMFISNVSAYGTTKLTASPLAINVPDIHGQGTFYKFSIDGYKAFCLNPGKKMASGLKYVIDKNYKVNVLSKQAFNYAENHSANSQQLAAQIVIWAVEYKGQTNHNMIVSWIARGLHNSFPEISVNDSWDYARIYFNTILSTTSAGTFYRWVKYGASGNYQPLIAKYGDWNTPGNPPTEKSNYCPNNRSISLTSCLNSGNSYDDCVNTLCYGTGDDDDDNNGDDDDDDDDDDNENRNCSLEIIGDLATCDGTSTSNSGYIKENPTNECTSKYTKYNYNASGKYREFSGSGTYCKMFCLQSFDQTYPGNIAKAVTAGRYIVWPNTNNDNNINKIRANLIKYPLEIKFEQTCDIYVDRKSMAKAYAGAKNAMARNSKYKEDAEKYYKDQKCDVDGGVAKTKRDDAQKALDECKKKPAEQGCKSSSGKIVDVSVCKKGTPGYSYFDINNCSSEQDAYDKADAEYKVVAARNTGCEKYGKALATAKAVISSMNSCASATLSNDLSISINYSSSYNDPTYGGSFNLKETASKTECNGCQGVSKISEDPNSVSTSKLYELADSIENRSISMTITKDFDLADGYYYYVDKKSNQSVSTAPSSRYSYIGFSNMPISYNAKTGKNNSNYYYNLILNASVSGTNFDSQLNSQNYTCHYEVTKTSSSCICPEGTMNAGKNLNSKIKKWNSSNSEKITCADAQNKWCDYSNGDDDDDDDSDLTCPNDPSMDLSACVNSGNSYEDCANTWCNNRGDDDDDNSKKYHCPKGTSNEGMDITACVIPMVSKGLSESEAYEYCKDVTCPIKGGVKIIYRTISLSNPFPSFDADARVTQKGLRVGMFNDAVKGRYPGSNWNGTAVVHNKILNNRGVDGDKVYNKTPLYTFTLNSDTIKAIRNYNKKQGNKYADFNLTCLKNNSSACVSSFIHDNANMYGLTSGTCSGKMTSNNFYTCDD